MSGFIEFQNVAKVYNGSKVAVENVDLSFEKGEFICFIGTSGSGKTTLMRMINRMNTPTSGKVMVDNQDVANLNPVELRRRIGYVIQSIGLMPHMTIRENITLVQRLLKVDEATREQTANKMIDLVELPREMLDRYPFELSGGQQQRIGVVRALAADQDIILMDEPFGALDPITREALQDLIKNLQEKLGKTVVFVTHDMDEALKLASQLVVMSHGRVVQADTPENVLRHPANEFVEELIGEERLLQSKPDNTTVGEIMIPSAVTIHSDRSLSDAITMMKERRVDSLIVTNNDGILQGIVDIQNLNRMRSKASSVGDIMVDVPFVHETDYLKHTLQKILNLGLKVVPVVDKTQHVVGLLTRSSLVDLVYDTIWGTDMNADATDDAGALGSTAMKEV